MNKRLERLERKIEAIKPKINALDFGSIYLPKEEQLEKFIALNPSLTPEQVDEWFSSRLTLEDLYPTDEETVELNKAHKARLEKAGLLYE